MQKLAVIALVAILVIGSAVGAVAQIVDADKDCVDDNTDALICPLHSWCNGGECECDQGTVQSEGVCKTVGWAARYVYTLPLFDFDVRRAGPVLWSRKNVTGDNIPGVVLCPEIGNWGFLLNWVDVDLFQDQAVGAPGTEVYCIYENETTANAAVDLILSEPTLADFFGPQILEGPRVYAFTLPTTSNPLYIPPTGLEVDSVYFKPDCETSGCWVIKGVLTTGARLWENNAFNTFYIPRAVGSDSLSYDYDYGAVVEGTFLAANHPCTSVNYDAADGLTQEVTTCCLRADDGFLANYRPTENFGNWTVNNVRKCTQADFSDAEVILRTENPTDLFADFDLPPHDVGFPYDQTHLDFLKGYFLGMNHSHVNWINVTDAFFGQYEFEIYLDEVELRNNAGILVGTVGVEHTIDTFLGITNFRTTGIQALDTFSTQIAIHLEKTSFFTVSTEGVNQYTFLEYVNLRLVAVYQEDADFSGVDESAAMTVRTNSSAQANYVQVTFTLGPQYSSGGDDFPLIPLDSVRAGHGTFFSDDSDDLNHMCSDWTGAAGAGENDFAPATKTKFMSRLNQDCAPQANMCVSPTSIPDSFVVFNIPLGFDYFDGVAGGASSTLSNNIFVDMVISAVETPGGDLPNDGGEPMQMKTTLTASIPIVDGGINIFCDGFTAKTDLKDVANADIVVGSASSAEELTRLRIMEDIASTQLDSEAITEIDSDSIEAGLMTLVLKGNNSYFYGTNTGRDEVTIELEDVITIHIMENDGDGSDTDVSDDVADLLAMPPADNSDASGLDTDGYDLNGAFKFTIDRSAQRAHLEPKTALTDICPFNPPRPDGSMELETCVTRRDVRYRGFPARTGAMSTAMELCTTGAEAVVTGAVVPVTDKCPAADSEDSDEALFFSTILGNNEYAKKLGSNYARVIAEKYMLNNRYRRAYFINPGYEWTPTQTGGTPIFSVSQKLYLFALITLDEGLTSDDGEVGEDVTLPSYRRRMLLQSTPSNVDEALQDGESSVGGGVFEFQTTPSQMMAKAFDVPQDRVATFTVKLQLTQEEACMSDTELQGAIRQTMADDYLTDVSTPFHTVQITRMAVDRAGVQCTRRSIRSLLSSWSDATVEATMLIVFEEGQDAVISLAKLERMAGVVSVVPLSVSSTISVSADELYQPPPSSSSEDGDGGGSSTGVAVIAGAAAGACVVLVAVLVGLWTMRKRSVEREVVNGIPTINIEELKHQLAADC